MEAFLTAVFLVTIAEMGDKTQLLAMAFATRFKAKDVLIGVFLATVLNHGLAVAVGEMLTARIPVSYIQVAAAVSFIGFGLWTLRGDKLEGEDKKQTRFGPMGTVAIAFFIAELGDKTQLATIALAAKYQTAVLILMGTTLGMLIADALGIWMGVLMGKKIPEGVVKAVSAGIFILFGVLGLYTGIPKTYINTWTVTGTLIVLGILIFTAVKMSYGSQVNNITRKRKY
ncbi:MAG TPA: TMEM165/GDT1 family protein [Desulfobacteria bacterium]|nr:TMEM165/GDT1 family protein [Desulfobacteria bacterium]